MKTTLSKDRDGRTKAASQEERNGILWDINTSKGYRGITCSAYRINSIKTSGAMIATSYSLLEPGHSLELAKSDERATEAAVMRVHTAGIARFEAMDSAGELPKADKAIEPGQVVFFDGPHDGESREYVYKVDGEYIYTVLADGSQLNRHDVWAVKPIEKRFGIGTYYRAGEVKPLEEVNQLVNDARAASEDRKATRAKEAEAQAQAAEAARVRGAEIITEIPAGMKAVIIGELHRNTSDLMTDYFGHTSDKIIYLAFSATDRDDFKEMRKAADKAEETRHLSAGPAEYEHREKYSMGAGYYLKDGHSDADGWAVEKARMPTLEKLQIAAGEGRYFANLAGPDFYNAGQGEQTTSEDPASVVSGTVQIVDYSEKAIAVIGDTKPIKDKLKALGGRFNFRLTCGAGWIFRKCDLDKVAAALRDPKPESVVSCAEYVPGTKATPAPRVELIPTAEEVEAVEPIETPQEETKPTGFFRETAIITTPGERRAEEKRKAKVTPQVPAPWSQHGAGLSAEGGANLQKLAQRVIDTGDKVAATSPEAREIITNVQQIVKEAAAGRMACAETAEAAADQIERIDTPKAKQTADTLRALATKHREELATVHQEIKAVQGSLFEQHAPAELVQYAKACPNVSFMTVSR